MKWKAATKSMMHAGFEELTSDIVHALISRIVFFGEGRIEIEYAFTDELKAFVELAESREKTGKYTGIGSFTIVDEADGEGASKWGLLKSVERQIICTYFCQIIITRFCHIPLVHAF